MNFSKENELNKSGFQAIAGLDEAGRGAWAGPIVAGAVLVSDYSIINKNIKKQVNDSKLLKPQLRVNLYDYLTSNLIWAVGVVKAVEIDKIGIGQANKLAMQRAIANLKVKPDYLLIDYIKDIGVKINTQGIKQGDRKVWTIAAASIIAKVYRDDLMRTYHKRYNKWCFNLHKGYGTKVHLARIKKHGITKQHRRSFKPIKALVK